MAITAGQTLPSGMGALTTASHSVMSVADATVENLGKSEVVHNMMKADLYNYFDKLPFVEVQRPNTWGLQFNTSEVSHDGAEFGVTEFADTKMGMPSVGVEGYITPVKAQAGLVYSDTEVLRASKGGEVYFKEYITKKYMIQAHQLIKKVQNTFLEEILKKMFDNTSDYVWDSRAIIDATHAYQNGVAYDNLINLPVSTSAEVEAAFDALNARVSDLLGADEYPLGGTITDVIVKKGSALAKRVRKLAQVSDAAAFAAGIVSTEGGKTPIFPTTTDQISFYAGTFNVIEVTGVNDNELIACDRNAMEKPLAVIVTQDISLSPTVPYLNGVMGYNWTWFGEFGVVNEPNSIFGIKEVV